MKRSLMLLMLIAVGGCATTPTQQTPLESQTICEHDPTVAEINIPMVASAKFQWMGNWWTHYDLAVYFAPVKDHVTPRDDYRDLVWKSLRRAQSTTPFVFSEVFSAADANITVYQQHFPNASFWGQASGPSSRGSFVDLNWAKLPTSDASLWMVEDLILHEIGHLLGLDHSSAFFAKMRPRVNFWSRWVCGPNFCSDDLNGLRELYEQRAELDWLVE